MNTRRLLLLAGLLGASACRSSESNQAVAVPAMPIIPAQAGAKTGPNAAVAAGTRAGRLEALRKEHSEAMNAYYQPFRDAKTDEERKKVSETAKAPDSQKWAPRFWEIVNEDPKDEVALDALTWLYEESRDKGDKDRALATILKEQITSPKLGDLCDRLGDPSAPAGILERVIAENPSREVKGRATYALATSRIESVRAAKRIKEMEAGSDDLKEWKDWVGEERFAELQKLDVAKAQAESESMLERVASEYADVKGRKATLGDSAKADLHEMRDLVVGKPAPEIAGEDLAGVAFKLSDYRGKVVMLDFWGNW